MTPDRPSRHDSTIVKILKFFHLYWYRNTWLTWQANGRHQRTRTEYIEMVRAAREDPEKLKQIIENRSKKHAQ